MTKKILNTGVLLIALTTKAFSLDAPPAFNNSNDKENNKRQNISLEYPQDTSSNVRQMPSKLQKNHFEINIDQEEVEDVNTKRARFKKLLDGTYGVNIMQEVNYRAFKPMDNVELLNNYQSVITFPEGMVIKKAVPSVSLKENRAVENVLILQGKKSFLEGNIVVSLSDGKKNYLVTLVLDKFLKTQNRKNDNVFNPFITYVKIPKISDYRLLSVYFRKYGKNRIKYFNKDGKYDVINYKRVPFYLIRDDRFGRIEYKGVGFRIANKL